MKIEFNMNSFSSTRSGISHDTEVFVDGELVHKTSAHYFNRTWEAYVYQSVIKKALDELIDEEVRSLRDEYKERTGRKRIPKDMVFDSKFLTALKRRRDEL